MGNRRDYLVENIVKICQKLDSKGFVANHDGNISVRFGDYLLATPTAESKSAINSDMIISIDMDGKKINGIGNPFSEIKLHIAAYNARKDAKAVVHAHPPFATARGLIDKPLRPVLPEAIVSIGDIIPVTPFAMPGDPENDYIITDALHNSDVFMMPGNGVLTIGDDIEQAYLRLELVEHLAKIDYYTSVMENSTACSSMTLSEENLQKLLDKRKSIGLGPQARLFNQTSEQQFSQTPAKPQLGGLRDIIAEEIRNVLNGT